MHPAMADTYRCPYSGKPLRIEVTEQDGDDVVGGRLLVEEEPAVEYEIAGGMPRLIQFEREEFGPAEAREREYYEAVADEYDRVLDWLFESFYEDEHEFRSWMIDLLELKPTDRLLETGAGTCRDTVEIARRLGPEGQLFVQDLSPNMLSIGRDRMRDGGLLDGSHGRVSFFIGNAARLPFPGASFDAAYHFGGLNLFTDRELALAEMARVVRPGGRVVVGDEGMAPWLREREYGKILMSSNQLYSYQAPTDLLPESSREVSLHWALGNAFWVIAFKVGEGSPNVDLDLPILGKRGGTHRTRYFGRLEGVTPEAKRLAEQAAIESGLTMHEWLERVVRAAAESGPGS
jgi:ubiquinone/menaquinone biosynthesis C-methylase UbiE